MSTRIRIDLAQGMVEAEGSEEFVRAVYEEFKDRLGKPTEGFRANDPGTATTKKPTKAAATTSEKASRKARPKNPQIVPDLDLSGHGKTESLRTFFSQFIPKTNFDNNLIFIYYLKQKLKLQTVGIDHIFTCYRAMPGLKIPGHLEQSLKDTRASKGWIDTKSLDDLQLNVPGINYLEHDMQKAEVKK